MKEWLKKWKTPLLLASIALILCFSVTVAYLTDAETKKNTVVLGQVSVKLTEDPYVDEQTVVPGQVVEKPPIVSNTGKNDAYVFLEVSIPKDTVQMLYESDEGQYKAGTLKDTEPTLQELFRTIANQTKDENENVILNSTTVINTADFQYHNPVDNNSQGWVFLAFGEETNVKKSYWFGYNRKLLAQDGDTIDKTIPIFDAVQLKSFIDEEITDDYSRSIGVNTFAIQSDNLKMGLDDKNFLNQIELQNVLKILETKKKLGGITYE